MHGIVGGFAPDHPDPAAVVPFDDQFAAALETSDAFMLRRPVAPKRWGWRRVTPTAASESRSRTALVSIGGTGPAP
ncbi:hypothetical protein [Pseudonocardia yunnanensis]